MRSRTGGAGCVPHCRGSCILARAGGLRQQAARRVVGFRSTFSLASAARREFQDAVTDVLAWAATSEQVDEGKSDEAPSYSMLWKVAVASFIPFMGFGFVDNFMMVCALWRWGRRPCSILQSLVFLQSGPGCTHKRCFCYFAAT